jgi:hypothetical protein
LVSLRMMTATGERVTLWPLFVLHLSQPGSEGFVVPKSPITLACTGVNLRPELRGPQLG